MNVGYKTETDLLKEEKIAVLEDKSNNSTKYVVWHVEGGLGKNIAATSLISAVKQKYKDRKLILVVSYPEVFLNHPDIHRVYRVGMVSYFYDDYIKDKDTIIFKHEPYFQSAHITKKKHLIENWCDLLDVKYEKQQPILYLEVNNLPQTIHGIPVFRSGFSEGYRWILNNQTVINVQDSMQFNEPIIVPTLLQKGDKHYLNFLEN
jgi:hypothetical protein